MPYTMELIRQLKAGGLEVHLIVSKAAYKVLDIESPGFEQVLELADHRYTQDELAAPMAGGTFIHQGMIVCPCSMASLGAIANGLGSNLIHRSADVTLKEKRPLVIVPRETPLNRIHLGNMLKAHDAGATILPPCPGFYHSPKSIDQLIKHIVSRILDAAGIDNNIFKRWSGVK